MGIELKHKSAKTSANSTTSRDASKLLIMTIPSQKILSFYALVTGKLPEPKSSNQSLSPRIRALTDAHLAYPQVLKHGHCMALFTRTKVKEQVREEIKLKEGGSNNDSPRITLNDVPGKVYIYHILAAYKAYTTPTPTLNLDRLALVTQDKKLDNALTILHLCGHKWCMNPSHYDIGSKKLNDQQTYCHRFLQSATSTSEYEATQELCRHKKKCWSIAYRSMYADTHHWVDE